MKSREEGFQSWSQLAAAAANHFPTSHLLEQLQPGDLVLLGARPGQGKTVMGLSKQRGEGLSRRSTLTHPHVWQHRSRRGASSPLVSILTGIPNRLQKGHAAADTADST